MNCKNGTVCPQPFQNPNIVSPDSEFYNIDTDESSYVDSCSDSDGDDTEDDMKEMTD